MYLNVPHFQRGAGLPVALFVITVLALIVAGMAQLQTSTAESVTLQLQSQRAFFAAESGAQLGVARALSGGCGAVPAAVPASGTFNTTGLQGCRATLSCTATTLDPGGPLEQTFFMLTSTGTCAAGAGGDVRRLVEVRVQ